MISEDMTMEALRAAGYNSHQIELILTGKADVPVASNACMDCDRIVMPRQGWVEIRGFAEYRTAGGTHAVALREQTGRRLCNECMTKRKFGINADQEQISV